MSDAKRILVAPLDWGLGHATRCLPVVAQLLALGAKPVLAAEGAPLAILREAFPKLEYIQFPGYRITYPKSGKMVGHMAKKLPGLLRTIRWEHRQLDMMVREMQLDGVISDNRYGLWNDKIPCVLITHQIFIRSPWFEGWIHNRTRGLLQHFDHCWIPDWKGKNNFSGDLSHGKGQPDNIEFIGPLSRFAAKPLSVVPDQFWPIVGLISGPEPQRTELENLLKAQLTELNQPALLIRGKADKGSQNYQTEGQLTVVNHLAAPVLSGILKAAQTLICRPGYSTLMDLAALGKTAIVIPTPGQTEQEYLGQLHDGKHWYCAAQDGFQLAPFLSKKKTLQPFQPLLEDGLLQTTIRNWLQTI